MYYAAEWYDWTPSDGPLGISLGGVDITSLYFPRPLWNVACRAANATFHTVASVFPGNGCETVPVQANTTIVTLEGSGGMGSMPVFASTAPYPPGKDPF